MRAVEASISRLEGRREVIRATLAGLLLLLASVATAQTAVTDEDFEVLKTRNLLNLCSVSQSDPRYPAAIHFCHGFLVGAHDYHMTSAGPERPPLVCIPDTVSRDQAVQMFVTWAKQHPQFMNEPPVDTEFRFLMETWPCKR